MNDLSRAVVERHAPAQVAADDATRARWRAMDWFATPPWATRAGLEVLASENIDDCFGGAGTIWEPACGDGIMAAVIEETGARVASTDIEPQGYGTPQDFLALSGPFSGYDTRWVITNPPFGLAAEFVERGLGIAKVGVAVLCRLSFLESVKRYDLHLRHLSDLAVFAERVPMQLGPWNPDCSTATAYAWFIFTKAGASEYPRLRLIPPGTRARLTRPDDVRRFGPKSDAPLFDLAESPESRQATDAG